LGNQVTDAKTQEIVLDVPFHLQKRYTEVVEVNGKLAQLWKLIYLRTNCTPTEVRIFKLGHEMSGGEYDTTFAEN